MQVPLYDVAPQNDVLRDEIVAAVTAVIDSGQFIGGPAVAQFEKSMAELLSVDHAIAVSSGTDALLVSLMAMGIHPGDEVITTPFTFFATAGVIARLGATPVFVDIDRDTYLMHPDKVRAYLEEGKIGDKVRTRAVKTHSQVKAILPVHLFGQCVDMKPLERVADQYSLMILEDSAQALMANYDGRLAGTMGDAGAFSFYPTKNLGGLGEGGLCVTQDEALAESIRSMRNHGQVDQYQHIEIGGNFRLDAMQCAALSVKLEHLNTWNEQRLQAAVRYSNLFQDKGLMDNIFLPRAGRNRNHTFHQFIIRCDRRDELREHLTAAGIGSNVYYPTPLHLQPCFKYLGYEQGDLPQAELASKEVLALPIFPGITEEQQVAVVDAISKFYATAPTA